MAARKAGAEENPNGNASRHPEPTVVVVDLANVAYGRQGRGESAKLANVTTVLIELARWPVKVVGVADAALRHKIDRKDDYEKMIDGGQVEQAPAGAAADDFIWSLAERYRNKGRATYILTNDRFPIERAKKAGMAHPDRITFMFVEGELILQPPLSDLTRAGGQPPLEPTSVEPSPTTPVDAIAEPEVAEAIEETLRIEETAQRLASAVESEQLAAAEVPAELLTTLRDFFSNRVNMGAASLKVNFATVAHFLHSLYGGNFTTQFGYRRPKDLALALAATGYVSISHHTTTLYIEPTPKLVGKARERETS